MSGATIRVVTNGRRTTDTRFIPGGIVHQEINADPDVPTRWVVVRSDPDPDPGVVDLPELDDCAEAPPRDHSAAE